ncbi:MAG: tetratricopeptide repeat protein [Chloroflexota bacterium]
MSLHTYLPQDRLRALTLGKTLPDRTTGAALFADISGFTALTESLREMLGPRRGAEELTRYLETVYTALIAEIERHGGSLIDFAGDSILCWFNTPDSELNPSQPAQSSPSALALACGLALQHAMRTFTHVTLPDGSITSFNIKVAIATGPARRFVVGDPHVHLLDVLAGATIARTAQAEQLAHKGEVLIDTATAQILDGELTIQEWRTDPLTSERFAVIQTFSQPVELPLRSPPDLRNLSPQELYPWLYLPLIERDQSGQALSLTEFRPCTALFVRFTGIDYDTDQAGPQLDAFIRQVQDIVQRHAGTFLQIIMGDKGSYANINFGVLTTHEDDERRAARTALEMLQAAQTLGFLQPLQIGLTQGMLRVGPNGSQTRQAFTALGDTVNLAARLMTNAAPGEILLSRPVHKAIEPWFVFEPRPPLLLKGKAEPLSVFALTGERQLRAIRLQEPAYSLPMVGRQAEMDCITAKLDLALQGQSQMIGILAEAGMGKSRLVAEVIRLARKKGFTGYGGACQSDAIHTPYQAWKPIWSAFFGIDPDLPLRKQIRHLEDEIEDRVPSRLEALPLLGPLLDLNIPENEFTQAQEPMVRQSALHALLEDCLKSAAKDEPLLIVIEDLHWIDAVSHDLLAELALALAHCPVCFVLAYRPSQTAHNDLPRLETLPAFTLIELHELNQSECEQAIRARLAQLYPARTGLVPAQLVQRLTARSQGNPFYLEELLNFLHDRGLDPRNPADLDKIELPDSLHTLVLSRIDQLNEREKTILRVASIIGRLFRAQWLAGYYPTLGDQAHIKPDLDHLHTLEITPQDSPEPELAYLFKHIVLHEVTYESQPFGMRALLHEQLACYLERQIAAGLLSESVLLDTLVHHYTHSANQAKQREYLRRAGEAAQKNFANQAALVYYSQLLPLLNDDSQTIEVILLRAAVFELTGSWAESEADYQLVLGLTEKTHASAAALRSQISLGRLCCLRGDFDAALGWLAQAQAARLELDDRAGLGQVLIEIGNVKYRKGEYASAYDALNAGLDLARAAADRPGMALAFNLLGNVAFNRGDYPAARTQYEASLALHRQMGDKRGLARPLGNLGNVALVQGDYACARTLFEESLLLRREMGDKLGLANALSSLGALALAQADYAAGQAFDEESLALKRGMGNTIGVLISLNNLGLVNLAQGNHQAAHSLFAECLVLSREIDDSSLIGYALLGLGMVALEQAAPGDRATPILTTARQHITESLRLRQQMGEQLTLTSSLIGLALLAVKTADAPRAALLLGAIDAALKTLMAAMEPEMREPHRQAFQQARSLLDEPTFQTAWQTGAALTLTQAVHLVLSDFDFGFPRK